jgi:hypothetical protein
MSRAPCCAAVVMLTIFVYIINFYYACTLQNVEELIDKDYLARVQGKDSYTYCA